jgi:exodeoxyribonuclease VII small subunit
MAEQEQLTFEQALERLEAIVSQLEGGTLPLEEALELFREGSQLQTLCQRMLTEAEATVEKLLTENTPEAPFGEDDDA